MRLRFEAFRTADKFALVALAVVVVMLGWVAWWLIAPYDPIELRGVDADSIPVEYATVPVGGTQLTQPVTRCYRSPDNRVPLTVTLQGEQFDPGNDVFLTISFPILNATINLPRTCESTPFVALIPDDVPPGVYHLEFDLQFEVNPLRKITERFSTAPFTVTP